VQLSLNQGTYMAKLTDAQGRVFNAKFTVN